MVSSAVTTGAGVLWYNETDARPVGWVVKRAEAALCLAVRAASVFSTKEQLHQKFLQMGKSSLTVVMKRIVFHSNGCCIASKLIISQSV